jgi:hypothetical protein
VRPIITALRTLLQSKLPVLTVLWDVTLEPLKPTTLAAFEFEPTELLRISMALTSGLPDTWTKSMLTVPSLVMSNDFIVPLLTPGSAFGSYDESLVTPSISTLNRVVVVDRLAK